MQTAAHQNTQDPFQSSVSFEPDSEIRNPLLFEFYDSSDMSDKKSQDSKEASISEAYEPPKAQSRYINKKEVKEQKSRRKDNMKRRQLELFPTDVSPIHGSNSHSLNTLTIPPFVFQPRFQLSKSDHIEPYQPNSKVRAEQKQVIRKSGQVPMPADKSFSVSSVRQNSRERHSVGSQQFAI